MTARLKLWIALGSGLALFAVAAIYTVTAIDRTAPEASGEPVTLAAGNLYFRDLGTGRVAVVPAADPAATRPRPGGSRR
ncbi:hypothetical protein AB0I28_13270 [Phytomonospora sp. NPDC050363]|uniref:hypothetical protein n=1 Tax=Phytomonospora sp. NPDC050363 TaxID=3155642 RepID=UPI0033DD1799